MKKLIGFLLLLGVCTFLVSNMLDDSGYIMVSLGHVTFESSIWGALLLLVLCSLVLWFIGSMFRLVWHTSNLFYPFSTQSKHKVITQLNGKGFIEFSCGNWKKAEKYFSRAIKIGNSSLLPYLAAAQSASKAGNFDEAADYLRRIKTQDMKVDFLAIGITKAYMQISANQLEQALVTVTDLYKKKPQHDLLLKLLKDIYIQLKDWQSLLDILPKLKKMEILNGNGYEQLEIKTLTESFNTVTHCAEDSDVEKNKKLQDIWNQLDSNQQQCSAIFYQYVKNLIAVGNEIEAVGMVQKYLNKKLENNQPLILLYGKIIGKNVVQQLAFVEKLLKENPSNAPLFLTAGRLANHLKEFRKARRYFESSLNICKTKEVYDELAKLLSSMGEYEKSNEFFSAGLSLSHQP